MTVTIAPPTRPEVAQPRGPERGAGGGTGRRVRPVRPRPPRPERPPAPPGAAAAIAMMWTVAGLCGWIVLQLLVLGGLEQGRSQHDLYNDFRLQLAAQTAPTSNAVPLGEPVALLTIPTLGLEQVVVQGVTSRDLLDGPGHVPTTALPGQPGVSVVYGRSLTYGGPFRAVTTLRAGDGIEVRTGLGASVYRVDGVRRAGDPLPAPPTGTAGRLTLVTSEGEGFAGWLAPSAVVYVDATLQASPDGGSGATAAGSAVPLPESMQPMGVDTSDLAVLVLAVQGVLLAVLGTVALRGRLPGRVRWVVAVPVLVAAAWVATDVAVQLLPNLV